MKVDHVDSIALHKDVRRHVWIPLTGQVSKVNTRIHEFFNVVCYCHFFEFTFPSKQCTSSLVKSLVHLDTKSRLTFRELEFLTCFLLTEFLTLDHTWVTSK